MLVGHRVVRHAFMLVAVAAAVSCLAAGSAAAKPAVFGSMRTLMAAPVDGGPTPSLWLKADAITGIADGGSVATWPDSSGNNHPGTQANAAKQPVFKAGVVNGLPVVRFNGSSTVLTTSLAANQKPVSVVTVVNFATKTTSTGTIVGSSTTGGIQLQIPAPTNSANGAGPLIVNKQMIAPLIVGTSETPMGAHILCFTYDGTGQARLYLDGRLISSGRNDMLFSTAMLWIGGNGSNSEYFSRDIGEVLVYNSALGDADRQSVESYLRNRWATPVAPAAQDPVLSPAGLRAWHKSDAIGGVANGAAVTAWGDSSGMNATALPSSPAPTFQSDVVAGLPVVRFGGGRFMQTKVPSNIKPVTLFALVYLSAPQGPSAGSVVGPSNRGGLELQLTPPNNGHAVTALNSEIELQIGAGKRSVPLGAHLLGATYASDGSWQLFVDGELVGSGVKAQALVSGVLRLGQGSVGPSAGFSESIGEFAAYDNVLSATDRQAIERYLMDKWGVFNVPLAFTFGDCDRGLDAKNPSGCLGGSNSATGAYATSATDGSLAGVGVPFKLTRTYNSNDSTSDRFGTGWSDNLGASLTVYPDWVTYRSDNGQQIEFMNNGGVYTPLGGSLVTLTAISGAYEIVNTDQTRLRFDSGGVLTSIKDRNGQGLALSYDGSGNLSSAVDAGGRQVTFTSNADGTVATMTLPGGRTVTYGYSGGKLTSVVDLAGGTWAYAYDTGGRLSSVTDPNGHADVRNTYGADGRLTEQLDALSSRTTYSWDKPSQTQTMTDPRGNAWKDVYRDNVLVKRIDPLGNSTSYVYDGKTLDTLRITDPRGNLTKMTYDTRHNMLTRTAPAPLSYQETWTYDALNDLVTYTDGRGNTTTNAYDAAGNPISKTQPGGVVTTYTRDPGGTGLLTALTDPRGKTTTFGYDAAKDLTSITQPLGEVTTIGYDSSGRITTRVDPRGNVSGASPLEYTTTVVYDDLDRKTSETDPLGARTQWAYDPVGNLLSTTNADNQTTSYGYDAANRLSNVTAPGAATTSYTYDSDGNLTQRTDPNAHVTSYSYDAANRLASTSDPLLHVWSYAYDGNGNKVRTTSPGGGITSYTYDQLNRLVSTEYSDSTPSVTYSYDANGNRVQMSDGAGSQSYTYDALSRLTAVSRGTDNFAYVYDSAGNVVSRTYPGGVDTAYAYDDDGRVTSATSAGQTTSYAYDAAGNLISTTLPSGNGYVESRVYDAAGRLTQLKNAQGVNVLSQYNYMYDPLGKATQLTKADGTAETYTYDSRGRLTEVCYQTTCPNTTDPYVRWTYDPVGNRVTEVRPSGTTSYTYDAADELTQAVGPSETAAYAYDARGNQIAAGSRTFSFDLADRETSTNDTGVATSYSYDGVGNRLTMTSGSTTINYLWDVNNKMPQLAVERDAAGTAMRTYVRGLNTISMSTGGSTFYYHRDRLGSVTGMTSSIGQTDWMYSYEPFGTARVTTQVDPSAPTNLLGFVGQYQDPLTRLINLRARQYDTATGRFLGTDPKPAGPTSPYESSYDYADQDPVNRYDLDGTVPNVVRDDGGPATPAKQEPAPILYNNTTSLEQGANKVCAWAPGSAKCDLALKCFLSPRSCADAKSAADPLIVHGTTNLGVLGHGPPKSSGVNWDKVLDGACYGTFYPGSPVEVKNGVHLKGPPHAWNAISYIIGGLFCGASPAN